MPMDMLQLLRYKTVTVIAIVYTIVLTIGSLIRPVRILEEPPLNYDKLLHAGAYFGLTVLWILWRFIKRRRDNALDHTEISYISILIISIIAVFYGIIIEYLQGAITDYRTPDGWDILANTIGVILALIASIVYINKYEMLKSKF